MKINLKLISLITILGSLFYFLSYKNKTNKSIAPIVQPKEQVIILDKKIINEQNKLNFNFYNITNFKSELNENDYIQVIICEKKELFYIQQ